MEIHADGIKAGQRALIVDDLLATGVLWPLPPSWWSGAGGRVQGMAVVIELTDLGGRARLPGNDIFTLLKY